MENTSSSPLTNEPLLRIEGVSKIYDGHIKAVDQVTLNVASGEIFALLGGSGCGKSTLLRMLAGFETPSQGRIYLGGTDITDLPAYQRPINMMFQSYALFPHLSVSDNIAFGLRRDGINIHSEVTLNYLQAILGDTIEVDTVDGQESLEIPAGTQPGAVLTLQSKGVPKLGNPVARGNHLVSIKVQLPTKLNAEERELLEQLAGHHTNKGHKHPHKSGLFGGLFG